MLLPGRQANEARPGREVLTSDTVRKGLKDGVAYIPGTRQVRPAAGIDIFTLARRMGASVKMIDRTYGHLVAGADAYERELLDAFDAGSNPLGRYLDAETNQDAA